MGCAGEWNGMAGQGPSVRDLPATVFAGERGGGVMVIWGGKWRSHFRYDGARYDPNADVWRKMSNSGRPGARAGHSAVWTGTEMIVWGGWPGGAGISGGRYDPGTDQWQRVDRPADAKLDRDWPGHRAYHTAVWTGDRMVVFGGWVSPAARRDTWEYRPHAEWAKRPFTNAPSARYDHTAVWTGDTMIVWGGIGGASQLRRDGGLYNPGEGWRRIPAASPKGRRWHTAVWTGTEMIVFGGRDDRHPWRFDPLTGSWARGAPASGARQLHGAVWTGDKMVVWGGTGPYGGLAAKGEAYDPIEDVWADVCTADQPDPRWSPEMVWTGEQALVWGGKRSSHIWQDDGGLLSPNVVPVGAR